MPYFTYNSTHCTHRQKIVWIKIAHPKDEQCAHEPAFDGAVGIFAIIISNFERLSYLSSFFCLALTFAQQLSYTEPYCEPSTFFSRKNNDTYHADAGVALNRALVVKLIQFNVCETTYGYESDIRQHENSLVFSLQNGFTFLLLPLKSMNYFIYLSIYWKMNVCHCIAHNGLHFFGCSRDLNFCAAHTWCSLLITWHFPLKCLLDFMRFQNVENLIRSNVSRTPDK